MTINTRHTNQTKPDEFVFCKFCKNDTKHKVLYSLKSEYFDDPSNNSESDVGEEITYDILQCNGCEMSTFRGIISFSEDYDEYGNIVKQIHFFPTRNKIGVFAKEYHQLPPNLNRIYRESIEALNNNLPLVCVAGLRTLTEGICKSQGIIELNLERKIQMLVDKGLITKSQAKSLHELRVLGNEAVHELSCPSHSELNNTFKIIENVLYNLYQIEHETDHNTKMRQSRKAPTDDK